MASVPPAARVKNPTITSVPPIIANVPTWLCARDDDRAHVLAALRCVDAVVIFDQDTPMELIQAVHPDVLVKGGDWTVDKIVGGEYVTKYGGEVLSLPLVEGLSTTSLVERIRHGG